MPKIEIKHPDKQISTGAYSAGVLIDGWLYISGHASEDLRTGEILGRTTAEQTRVTLTHIGKVLAAAGLTFADVVKCTCHLADIKDFDEFNAVYREFFPPPLPARTTVQSVIAREFRVEIDAIARVPQSGPNS
ncbi:MAG: RidA family protein [Bryobacteraceae bacterium]